MFTNAFKTGIQSLLIIALTGVVSAQTVTIPTESAIDAAVLSVMESYGGTGTAITIMKDGAPLFTKGYGMADVEHMVPVDQDTVFQSGSVGKMFTAAAIMLLRQEGKLKLDDSLRKYFPSGPRNWKKITLRHMLAHRSGFARLYGPDTAIWPLYGDMNDGLFVEGAGKADSIFEPGSNYSYSNGGYVLLGIIIRKVSGQFYGDYLKEKLFIPLGMKTAQVNEQRHVIAGRAQGYVEKDEKLLHADYVGDYFSQTADGSLLFTIKDLVKWEQALYGRKFLSEENFAEMFQGGAYSDGTTGVKSYGYGWDAYELRGRRLTEHTGYWQGFSTYVARYIDDGFAVSVLTNSRKGAPKEIATAVAGLFNADYGPYVGLADQSMAPKLKKLTIEYLTGTVDPSLYAASAKADIAPAKIRRVRGEIKIEENPDFEVVEKRVSGSSTVYTLRFSGERGRESAPVFFVTYNVASDDQITGISFQLGR